MSIGWLMEQLGRRSLGLALLVMAVICLLPAVSFVTGLVAADGFDRLDVRTRARGTAGVALGVAPIAAQNKTLFISGPAATDGLTGANKYTFRSGRQS